jgi:two-component system response regulator HydG
VPGIHTRDPAFARLLLLAERAAGSQASVLLNGESGTGKNRLARWIHERSTRAAEPFVEVPCANIAPELFESELFGHERGAFTDAHDARVGRFERADHGTLYLDEIGELSVDVQAKVLRAIQERRFERLGGTDTITVDVRWIASTRTDPSALVEQGRLREDLYYRIQVIQLDLPPLRERAVDIPALANTFLADALARHALPPRRFADVCLERFARHPWPGNLRELAHAVESAAVLASGEEIGLDELPPSLSVASPGMVQGAAAAGLSLRALEAEYILEVLARTGGNKSAAARILGIARKTLHEKLRALDEDGG